MRVLLLGGTTEAGLLAHALAQTTIDCIYSYAGRTSTPVAQPLPTRMGGFGGVAGLAEYLKTQRISHVVDATHPFAEQMSRNTVTACAQSGVKLIRFERPPWVAQSGDIWTLVPRMEDLPSALPDAPACVFLAIGKQQLQLFAVKPQHHYVLRLVDAPAAPLPLRNTTVILDRGPFTMDGDITLMRDHSISHVVAKNAGGSGARAKLDAARALKLPVIMADRPTLPQASTANTVDDVMAWLAHDADLGV